MKVKILTGFLGAGKSTVASNIFGQLSPEEREELCIINNEVGGISLQESENGNVLYELGGGCICCSLKDQLYSRIKSAACDQGQCDKCSTLDLRLNHTYDLGCPISRFSQLTI